MEESDVQLTPELASTFLAETEPQHHDIVEGPPVSPDVHLDNQVQVDGNDHMHEENQLEALATSEIDSQPDRSTSRRERDRGGGMVGIGAGVGGQVGMVGAGVGGLVGMSGAVVIGGVGGEVGMSGEGVVGPEGGLLI